MRHECRFHGENGGQRTLDEAASGSSVEHLRRSGETRRCVHDVERREEERKKQGYPRVLSAVFSRTQRLPKRKNVGAEQERKKTRRRKSGSNGGTTMAPMTPKELREIERRSKAGEKRLRGKYPEVHGMVVDFITHTIDDGTLYFTVHFTDQTSFAFAMHCDMFAVGAELSDGKAETPHHPRVHEAHSEVGHLSVLTLPESGAVSDSSCRFG